MILINIDNHISLYSQLKTLYEAEKSKIFNLEEQLKSINELRRSNSLTSESTNESSSDINKDDKYHYFSLLTVAF